MHREQGDAVKAERIEAVKALLDEAKIPEYEAILAAEQAARDTSRDRSSEIFDRAVAETMKILSPEQQEKYRELMAHQRERHRPNGRREGGPPPPPGPPGPPPDDESGDEDR